MARGAGTSVCEAVEGPRVGESALPRGCALSACLVPVALAPAGPAWGATVHVERVETHHVGGETAVTGKDGLAGSPGAGPDVLIGDANANRLDGRGGRDRVHGAGGDDRIRGGPGPDMLIGGRGDDLFVDGSDNARDVARDIVRGSCEDVGSGPRPMRFITPELADRITAEPRVAAAPRRVRRGRYMRVVLRSPCPDWVRPRECAERPTSATGFTVYVRR